jgi:hypothetical protein
MDDLSPTAICDVGQIPIEERKRFLRQLKKAVDRHYRLAKHKDDIDAAQKELRQLQRRIKGAIALTDRKTWRPGEFKIRLDDISRALRELSAEARELLALRNLRVSYEPLPNEADAFLSHLTLIDPLACGPPEEQLVALQDLYGALVGPFLLRRRGDHRRYIKDILFFDIACAYGVATGKRGDDHNRHFMDMLDEIERAYDVDLRPGSRTRQARQRRAQERRLDEE